VIAPNRSLQKPAAATGQLHRSAQVQEFFPGNPAPSADELIFHDGDMRGRPAKGRRSQSQKHERQLFKAGLFRGLGLLK
jgi:hypothetical protein